MSFAPNFTAQQYLNDEFTFADDPREFRNELEDFLKKNVEAVNTKDIGLYYDVETVNGQQWFTPGEAGEVRQAIRKVIDMGGLNDFTTTNPQNVAHNIAIDANIVVTRLYGVATDPNTSFIPLPYVDMSGGGNHIGLSMDGTNIILESNLDYSGYTTAYVVVEFIQNT